MIFEEKTITLKNGETCVLRSPEIGEAEVLLDYLKKATAETDYLLFYPDEVTMTIEDEINYIKNMREAQRGVMICAFIGNKLVGNTRLASIGEKYKISPLRFVTKKSVTISASSVLKNKCLGPILNNSMNIPLSL
jgi:hypothetical protein